MTKEALKLALEALEMFCEHGAILRPIETRDAIKEALANEALEKMAENARELGLDYEPEQDGECKYCTDGCPACDARKLPTQEPVAWVYLLKEAQQIVESKVLWKRFIDGTPLSNDIACWMAAFAQQHATPPQRTWVGLDWLPEHKCGLHLSHNEHRDVYETIEQFYDSEDFISSEEWHKSVAKDSVWVLHWYPETPIGFIRIAASTLDAIEAKLRSKNESKN